MKSSPPEGHRFVGPEELLPEAAERGSLEWLSHKDVTDARQLMIVRATMEPGQFHGFHYHPRREEVIYVLEGSIEQWVGEHKRILGPGEVAHMPAEMVHASFTLPGTPVTFLAILSPCQFDDGEVEFMVDVSDQEPWASLLKARESTP